MKPLDVAKMTQLMLEYAPAPPFDAGTPESAGPELTAMARAANRQVNEEMITVAEELAVRAGAAPPDYPSWTERDNLAS